jgi:hypothetical protein
MLTEDLTLVIEYNAKHSSELMWVYANEITQLCSDWRELTAQVAELQRQAQNNYINRGAIDGTSDGKLLAQVAALTAQRDEKAAWVTELQGKLAQALAALNDDLSKMQAQAADLQAARRIVFAMYHGAPLTKDERNTVQAIDAALAAQRAAEKGR